MEDNKIIDGSGIGITRLGAKIESDMIKMYNNTPVEIEKIKHNVVTKIPIILSQLSIQFNITASVKLPERALEIRRKDNKLNITQCILLQETNSLFIKGFIREGFEYLTVKDSLLPQYICGEIHHCVFDVPFEFITKINFNYLTPYKEIPIYTNNYKYLRDAELPPYRKSKNYIKGDTDNIHISTDYFNDSPYCQLINSKIVSHIEYLNKKIVKRIPIVETVFDEIEEKIGVNIILQILQKRYINIMNKLK